MLNTRVSVEPPNRPRAEAPHANAIRRRKDALERYLRLSRLAGAAVDTPAENDAADRRDAARAQVRASEAWVEYIERTC